MYVKRKKIVRVHDKFRPVKRCATRRAASAAVTAEVQLENKRTVP